MFRITRQIGIDMGHRVPDHGSKCRSPHGHRYTIEAICVGELHKDGEEVGMVMDFGFLKEEMMSCIDEQFDHAFCFYYLDDHMIKMFGLQNRLKEAWPNDMGRSLRNSHGFKVYVMRDIPTAENLAALWFNLLTDAVDMRSDGKARLEKVKVWETPNCWVEFPA